MSETVIVLLVVVALYLGRRWRESSAENAELRNRVDLLQRRLARQRR